MRDGRGSEEGRSRGRQSSIAASVRPPILSKPGRTPSICEFWTSGRRLDGESGTGMLVGRPLGPPGVCVCLPSSSWCACLHLGDRLGTRTPSRPTYTDCQGPAVARSLQAALQTSFGYVRARHESTAGVRMGHRCTQAHCRSCRLRRVLTSIDASLNVLARPWRSPLRAGSPADCTHVPASLAMTRPGPAAMTAPSPSPSQRDGTDRPCRLSPPQPMNHARPSIPIGQDQRDIAGRGHGPRHRSASPLRKADDGRRGKGVRPAPGISMDTRYGSWQPAVRSCSSPRGIVAGNTSAALCSSPQLSAAPASSG